MTCILCHSWNQTDPNCGHYLLNGIRMPAHRAILVERSNEMLGPRARGYATAENRGSKFSKYEHIVNQANLALSGGWG